MEQIKSFPFSLPLSTEDKIVGIGLHPSQRNTVLDLSNTMPMRIIVQNPTLLLTKCLLHNAGKQQVFFISCEEHQEKKNNQVLQLRRHFMFFTINSSGYRHKIQNKGSQGNRTHWRRSSPFPGCMVCCAPCLPRCPVRSHCRQGAPRGTPYSLGVTHLKPRARDSFTPHSSTVLVHSLLMGKD